MTCKLTKQEEDELRALVFLNQKGKVSDSPELNYQAGTVKRRGKISKIIESNTTAKT